MSSSFYGVDLPPPSPSGLQPDVGGWHQALPNSCLEGTLEKRVRPVECKVRMLRLCSFHDVLVFRFIVSLPFVAHMPLIC